MDLQELLNQEFERRRQRIVEMHKSGVKVAEIARIEKVTRQRIYAILRQQRKQSEKQLQEG